MSRILACILALMFAVTIANAAEVRRSTVNYPYRFPHVDAFGNTWMLYNGGRLMQQGNMPFSGESASIIINGQGMQAPNQQLALEDTEAIIENARVGQFSLTRRFLQNEDGVMRIIDIIRNNRNEEVTANVTINFQINFGLQNSRQLTDPRKTDKLLAAIATDGQNRTLLSVFAGKNAKLTPSINATPNNSVQAVYEIKLPPGKQAAIVHFHKTYSSADQAEKEFATLSEARAISSLPTELRKLIVNFPSNTSAFDDLDILRGTTNDVLELANGDQLHGDLLSNSWTVATSFGQVEIRPEEVIGLMVPTGLSARHLVITRDGEIVGGKLQAPTLEFQVASGQRVSIPIDKISRMGVRTSADEKPAAPRPMVVLMTGDRLAINLPEKPLEIATRFGILHLPASSIASIDLQPDQSPVHQVMLTDGSSFSGLLLEQTLSFPLARGGNLQAPMALVRKLVIAPATEEDPVSQLRLTGEDLLAATLPEQVTLLTAYGQVAVNGAEIKGISRVKNTLDDIQVQLWDDSTITGRLAEPMLECSLAGGAVARVPVGVIERYVSTAPQPAAGIVERIHKLVEMLNADDWRQREQAEADLVAMGNIIVPTLQQLRENQPPEARQWIDSILNRLGKGSPSRGSSRRSR